ncbi:GNAT family N-acetyltransferase [Stieleria sp. TO1_6]|uniref:GNAT family N-acetyltransferase n=1 Tax=Stieleria tagensis TaxID=2956795 RepID=UPI00209AD2E4|nr:GNAT family N-acetyltransferase [Stieleria tagensis]MCO8125343.1 GNAT family N-acetyltransferase [Stieleria tagensis]
MDSGRLFCIRPFIATDAEGCLNLFRETVRRINARDYSAEQIRVWAPEDADVDAWRNRFNGRFAYVACEADSIVGFADMTRDGHLDRLFVSADHQRQGIARRLMERLIQDAMQQNCDRITTESSVTAKPFFLAAGFRVLEQQSVLRQGVSLVNYKMQRSL